MINRTYLNQIALIESECEPRKKQPMISTYTKSPLRDRENKMNIGNTPSRISAKASLSPLRSRRTDSSLMVGRAESSLMGRSNFARKREFMCINEPHKVAKYIAYSEEESLYYCEKCAILLASQGFTVMKLGGSDSVEINPRKEEVDGFLADLESTMSSLGKKSQAIGGQVGSALQALQEEEAKVEEYYGHFYEIIDEHKRRVLEELKDEYESAVKATSENAAKIDSALADSKRMKEDIVESMNIILNESREEQFRPIMDNYQANLRDYRSLAAKTPADPILMRRLDFRDPEAACKALEDGLQMQWEQRQMEYSKQSEPENPVEVIETDEKFTKSSLKEIGNLFSSFDE